jgi:hypothetical protein
MTTMRELLPKYQATLQLRKQCQDQYDVPFDLSCSEEGGTHV